MSNCQKSNQRATWIARPLSAATLSGLVLAILPKCPACIAEYAAFLTWVSASELTMIRIATGLVLAISVVSLMRRILRRRLCTVRNTRGRI